MRFLKEKVVNRIEVSKSVFIAVLYQVESKEDIDQNLLLARKDYPNANHYCCGAIYGESGEYAYMDDDGEPQRTSGIPILEVLKHHDVTNILCVVIRYFGGIKLGAPGLIRAYTKACADVMTFASLYTKQMASCYEITFGYHLQNHIDQFMDKAGTIQKKSYTELVTYVITIENENIKIDHISHLLDQVKQLEDCTIYTNINQY
jgi:uncharacterized YigZ family protein